MKRFLIFVPALMLLSACASKRYSASDGQGALNRFQSRFNASHPDHPISNELLEMGVQYGAAQGWEMNSQAGVKRLEEELKAVVENSDASSRWLFRGTFHAAGTTNAFTQTVYGLATAWQSNAELEIASYSEKAGMRFKGFVINGRVTGHIRISAGPVVYDAKAAGSLVPRRISLDSHGANASEVVRGSFIFLK